jgi:3-hydroxy-3-methylglutaryl CoA synthase
MRGIISRGVHVPFRRLDRKDITAFLGAGGGSGTRSVASYDEDTTTMAVEAGRRALRAIDVRPTALTFSTTEPAYVEKTNATAIHAALRLDRDVPAADFGGGLRSSTGALRAALDGEHVTLVAAADVRTGLPGSADESAGGDAAAALLVGSDADAPLIAEHLGSAGATAEFVDRWRTPGEVRTKQWEEKFGEVELLPLGERAWNDALKAAGVTAEQVDRVAVVGPHARAVKALARRLGVGDDALADDLTATIGQAGAAHPLLALASMLDVVEPGATVAVVAVADGADAFVFRATDAIVDARRAASVASQIEHGGAVSYAKFLAWRGMLTVEPPRRPEPARVSSSAAARSEHWKYAFVGSRDRSSGAVHLPPSRVSMSGGAVDDMDPIPMADARGTIVTFTVDRLAYSPSPPVVFAVVDFDAPGGAEPGSGGRLPIELTDVDEADVQIGTRVEMTFRRLNSADGIHNYFWKARPLLEGIERG